MATPAPKKTTPALEGARTDNDRRMFGNLREIRGTAQYLQNAGQEALTRAAAVDPAARSKYVAEALPAALKSRVDALINPALDAIQEVFRADAEEFEWCADTVAGIRLQWEQVKDLWPAASMGFDQIQQVLAQAGGCLDQIIY